MAEAQQHFNNEKEDGGSRQEGEEVETPWKLYFIYLTKKSDDTRNEMNECLTFMSCSPASVCFLDDDDDDDDDPLTPPPTYTPYTIDTIHTYIQVAYLLDYILLLHDTIPFHRILRIFGSCCLSS
jgi:hypothetical protein